MTEYMVIPQKPLTCFGLNDKEEGLEWWRRRVREKNGEQEI